MGKVRLRENDLACGGASIQIHDSLMPNPRSPILFFSPYLWLSSTQPLIKNKKVRGLLS